MVVSMFFSILPKGPCCPVHGGARARLRHPKSSPQTWDLKEKDKSTSALTELNYYRIIGDILRLLIGIMEKKMEATIIDYNLL